MTTCYDAEERQENETSMGIYKQKIRYKQDIFWSHVLDMVTGEELIKMDIVYAPKPGEQLLPIGDRNYGTDISTHLGLGGMEGMRRKANMFTAFVIQNIGRETIKVPAGTFDTYHVRITSVMEDTTMDFEAQPMLLMGPSTHIYGQTVTKDVWFSYDVRNIVRMESVSQETEEQMGEMLEQETTTVMELVSYSL
ncbi:MAG TPA: DUF3108 domain-containing protein [Thermoplasmata archaeon]|nr:DUF3108 domain-containing protein [Thermoplasmata archaeon]